jgi:glutathione S-transferase
MFWLKLITVLALIEYMVLGIMVGRARTTYNVPAPATTGDPTFERYFRVHQNTLEALIVFLPAVWMYANFVNYSTAIILGLIFIIGRVVYAAGYIGSSEGRAPGALVSIAVNAILVLGSLIGILIHRA